MPNFSKMTVDALMTARGTIDKLLKKRVPGARKELEKRLIALSGYFGGDTRKGGGVMADGRSKLKGRKIKPKYRGKEGETWTGRGMMPRWLAAEVKRGAKIEDFAIGAGGRGRKGKKAAAKSGKKRPATKRAAPKRRKATKPARKSPVSAPQAEPTAAA